MALLNHHRTVLAGVLAVSLLAALMTWSRHAFAQAQPQMVSAYLATGLPLLDPDSPQWAGATAVEIPLTAQRVTFPMLGESSIPSMQVRSLNDGQWIVFRLEWSDATRNDRAITQDQFRDAAAIQLPVDHSVPGICMGVRGQMVNLWHWKADWQNDIDNGFQDITAAYPNFWKDYYPFAVGDPPFKAPTDFADPDAKRFVVGWAAGNPLSDPYRVTPVEELIAEGFGTATHREDQGVLGRGVWSNGRWAAVFARPLATSSEIQSQLPPGGEVQIAVAAWNGANGEVGARKQISADFKLLIAAPRAAVGAADGAATPSTTVEPRVTKYWITYSIAGVAVALTIITAAAGHLAGGLRRPRTDATP
jgi:hypothetical protein